MVNRETYFEHAIGVDEQVARLDVPVNDPGPVQVLEPSEYLVEEDLDVVGRQRLRTDDDLVQVTLHQFQRHVAANRETFRTQKDKRRLHRNVNGNLHD